MSIGTGIAHFVVGAILAFALNLQVGFIDLHLVGYILMAAGVIVFIVGIVLLTRRRQAISTTHTAVDPASGEQVTRRSTESDPLV
jgi:protein-S-isoprenylcysteine O-methyltransferase Ste14